MNKENKSFAYVDLMRDTYYLPTIIHFDSEKTPAIVMYNTFFLERIPVVFN